MATDVGYEHNLPQNELRRGLNDGVFQAEPISPQCKGRLLGSET